MWTCIPHLDPRDGERWICTPGPHARLCHSACGSRMARTSPCAVGFRAPGATSRSATAMGTAPSTRRRPHPTSRAHARTHAHMHAHTPLTHAHRALHVECRASPCLSRRGVARAALALAPPPRVSGEVYLTLPCTRRRSKGGAPFASGSSPRRGEGWASSTCAPTATETRPRAWRAPRGSRSLPTTWRSGSGSSRRRRQRWRSVGRGSSCVFEDTAKRLRRGQGAKRTPMTCACACILRMFQSSIIHNY